MLPLKPVEPRPEGDVVVDRLRERVRLLEDHPDPPPDLDRIDAAAVQVLAVVQRSGPRARVPGIRSFIRLIVRSSVDLPQPDGPMSAVIRCGRDVDRDVLHRPEGAVVERHVVEGAGPRAAVGSAPSVAAVGRRPGRRRRVGGAGRSSVRSARSAGRSWSSVGRPGSRASVRRRHRLGRVRLDHHRWSYRLRRRIGDGVGEEGHHEQDDDGRRRQARGTPPGACAPSRRRSSAGPCTDRSNRSAIDAAGRERAEDRADEDERRGLAEGPGRAPGPCRSGCPGRPTGRTSWRTTCQRDAPTP